MMVLFWIAALLLALLAGLWLVIGMRAGGRHDAELRKRLNVAAFRERLAELEAEQAGGRLGSEDFAQARQDLERRLLEDVDTAGKPLTAGAGAGPLRALILILPVLAAGGIFALSDGAQHFRPPPPAVTAPPQVEAMIEQLAQRLGEQPEDLEGWRLLGRSYSVLQRHAEAAKAYGRANQINGGQDAELLVAEGEALALARDKDLLGQPQRLMARALELDPQNVRALWYAAIAARQEGRVEQAEAYFGRLRTLPNLPDELREILGVAKPAAAASGTRLDLKVSVAEAMQDQYPSDAVLYVYAKARSGPPMPLAIQRLQAAALPLQVVLDDSMSMVEGMNLSRFNAWTVVARISESGEAQPQSGDLVGEMAVQSDSPQPLELTIDTRLP